MKLHNTTIALTITLLLLLSCNKADDISGELLPGNSPIMLSAEATTPFTRTYIPTGMCEEFKVNAVAEIGGTPKTVMGGYKVKYVTGSWTYVTDTQELMYWDNKADRYLFTAGAPIAPVKEISANEMKLHLANNQTASVMAGEPIIIEKGTPEFGKIVNLRFGYAHCRVCVAFVKNAESEVAITDIKLTPDAAITKEADLTYSYDWSTSKPTVTTQLTDKTTSSDSFSFSDVTIAAGTSDAVLSETRYYCVPDATNTSGWTVSLTCDGEQKSGAFVNEYQWESGKNYIYIFSLDEKTPKLIYVLSREMDYFDCNDIVPGGEFSGSNMTE